MSQQEPLPEIVDPTVFRAFERSEFLEWPAWGRLEGILRATGGSYGLSGPRGAGKSWLMRRAIDAVPGRFGEHGGGIGLWYPSPSEYDALAFLASLSDSLASAIERRYRQNHPLADVLRPLVTIALPLAGAAAIAITLRMAASYTVAAAVTVGLGAGIVAAVVTRLCLNLAAAFGREGRLLREARLVRERARYIATQTEGFEVGADAGTGLVGRVKTSQQRQLVDRPATLSSMVNDFRALAALAGETAGNVVIAIDELDKMDKPQQVHDLLRDIKGIFEVPRVYFLVSVSDEAARSLNLGALYERNVFNSSFYTVLELPPAAPDRCADLLEGRAGVPRDVAIVIAVLAGGNPREVLRLAELIRPLTTGQNAAIRILKEEALSLRREIVTANVDDGGLTLTREDRLGAFKAIPEAAFDELGAFTALAASALGPALWDPPWATKAFTETYREEWRRLLIRLNVAGRLAGSKSVIQESEEIDLLQNVVITASQSAEVGRLVLDEQLTVATRHTVVSTADARSELTALARRYEDLRGTPASADRTAQMTDLLGAARSLSRAAEFTSDELNEMLSQRQNAGDRVVALATVQATADPHALEALIRLIFDSPSAFEQYHALSAIDSLRPSLSESERDEVAATLIEARSSKWLREPSDRRDLLDRIVRTLEREETPTEVAQN